MNRFLGFWNTRTGLWWLLAALPIAYVLNVHTRTMLDASYEASRFPVPYFVAQASFDPAQIKAWYATLISQGTMPTYLYTQHIDYLFMLSTLLLHFLALVIVARLLPEGSRWRRGMLWCAALSALAPLADALENLVSYVMLADPLEFADAWAYVYSTFAVVKFAMFAFTYVAVIVGLVAALVFAIQRLARFAAARARQ